MGVALLTCVGVALLTCVCACLFFSYTSGEIHFNLMAVVGDRKRMLEREIQELTQRRDKAAQRVGITCTRAPTYFTHSHSSRWVTRVHTHTTYLTCSHMSEYTRNKFSLKLVKGANTVLLIYEN